MGVEAISKPCNCTVRDTLLASPVWLKVTVPFTPCWLKTASAESPVRTKGKGLVENGQGHNMCCVVCVAGGEVRERGINTTTLHPVQVPTPYMEWWVEWSQD